MSEANDGVEIIGTLLLITMLLGHSFGYITYKGAMVGFLFVIAYGVLFRDD